MMISSTPGSRPIRRASTRPITQVMRGVGPGLLQGADDGDDVRHIADGRETQNAQGAGRRGGITHADGGRDMSRLKLVALGPEVKIQDFDGGTILYDGSRAGNAAPGWLDASWWAQRGEVRPAAEGRGAAVLIEADGRSLVLRHYRRGGLIARISADRYLWRGADRTRSFQEWQLLYLMHRAGLPVPQPVAAGYRRTRPHLHCRPAGAAYSRRALAGRGAAASGRCRSACGWRSDAACASSMRAASAMPT